MEQRKVVGVVEGAVGEVGVASAVAPAAQQQIEVEGRGVACQQHRLEVGGHHVDLDADGRGGLGDAPGGAHAALIVAAHVELRGERDALALADGGARRERPACLVEQGAGGVEVDAAAGRGRDVGPGAGQRAGGDRQTLAVGGELHQARQIHGEGQGAAHAHVGERVALAQVKAEEEEAVLRVAAQQVPRRGGRDLALRAPGQLGEQQLAPGERLARYGGVWRQHKGHAVEQGGATMVAIKALQHDRLAGAALAELERAAAHRQIPEVQAADVALLKQVARQHRHRQGREDRREAAGERDHHSGACGRGGPTDVAQVGEQRGGGERQVAQALQGEEHIRSAERRAVVPAQAAAQREGDGATVGRGLPAFGEIGHRAHALVEAQQAIVEQVAQLLLAARAGLPRAQLGDVGGEAHGEIAAARQRRGRGRRKRGLRYRWGAEGRRGRVGRAPREVAACQDGEHGERHHEAGPEESAGR